MNTGDGQIIGWILQGFIIAALGAIGYWVKKIDHKIDDHSDNIAEFKEWKRSQQGRED